MSGPIIRKYGFANFDKIFGERELKHGVESDASKPGPTASTTDEATRLEPPVSETPPNSTEASTPPAD